MNPYNDPNYTKSNINLYSSLENERNLLNNVSNAYVLKEQDKGNMRNPNSIQINQYYMANSNSNNINNNNSNNNLKNMTNMHINNTQTQKFPLTPTKNKANNTSSSFNNINNIPSNSNNALNSATKVHKYMKDIDGFICYSTHVIGKGSFGKVVYGKRSTGEDICFKFEKICNHKTNSILKEEYKMYKQLKGGIGIPEIHNFGLYKGSRYLAMELIGPSLDKFFNLCDKKLNLETTIFLGIQMIDRLYYVHSKGIVHRDIKPNNFLFGKFKKSLDLTDRTVYIIDFGLSAPYLEFDHSTGNGSTCLDRSLSKYINNY